MIWFIIGLIVAIVTIVRICLDDWNELGEKIGYSVLAVFTSFVISLLVWLLASVIISCGAEVEYNKVSDSYPCVAIHRKIPNHFFLNRRC